MIVLQGAIPDICKKCKKTGGLEDGLYLIHTEEDFVNFYCDGQSLKICPIIGEIPDKHGRLGDLDIMKEAFEQAALIEASRDNGNEQIYLDRVKLVHGIIDRTPTILEASTEGK